MQPFHANRVQVSVGFFLACLAVLSCGCGSGVEQGISIKGKVTYNGEPLQVGTVRYEPVDRDKGRAALGSIQSDGTFAINTSANVHGVLPGEYRIAVTSFEGEVGAQGPPGSGKSSAVKGPGKSLIPQHYSRGATSGLTDTVDENHSGTKDIALDDSPPK